MDVENPTDPMKHVEPVDGAENICRSDVKNEYIAMSILHSNKAPYRLK